MPEWQAISSRSHRYRIWICDEEMFFIPLCFLLHHIAMEMAHLEEGMAHLMMEMTHLLK
jgi:hypothetical protein